MENQSFRDKTEKEMRQIIEKYEKFPLINSSDIEIIINSYNHISDYFMNPTNIISSFNNKNKKWLKRMYQQVGHIYSKDSLPQSIQNLCAKLMDDYLKLCNRQIK